MYGPEDREDEREYDDQMADAMELGYDDGLRFDEMQTAEDYNRFEENQIDLDREWDDTPSEADFDAATDDYYRDFGDEG